MAFGFNEMKKVTGEIRLEIGVIRSLEIEKDIS